MDRIATMTAVLLALGLLDTACSADPTGSENADGTNNSSTETADTNTDDTADS